VRLARPALPLGWLALGGLLPDLVDKPLYYALVFATGRRAAELGLVSGTRTFGHTGLFLLGFVALAAVRKTPATRALAWGVASHLVLDLAGDAYGLLFSKPDGPTILNAILFPLLGARFPISPFKSVREHLLSVKNLYVLGGELLGLVLLAVAGWRRFVTRARR
jgi:LexA-binding, inner membrane-associated putative hydrolase